MSEPICYVNGKFLPKNQAVISVFDLGLLRGFGVFDFTRTYNRIPFKLQDHLERLRKSARIIDLDFPWDTQELISRIFETLSRNPRGEKGIRIIVTGGEGSDSLTPGAESTLIILITPEIKYPQEYFTEGVKVITFSGKREIPDAKTLNYTQGVKALKRARKEGAHEAVYTSNGKLYECVVCSFFAVKDNAVITADSDVLDGITRKTILEIIKEKIPIEYRFVTVSDIPSLDEAFLSSSFHEVMPITTIDKTRIGNGKPGPLTKEIMALFREYTLQKL